MAESSPQQSCTGPEVTVPGTLRLFRSWTTCQQVHPPRKWLTSKRWDTICAVFWDQPWDTMLCGLWGHVWNSTTMEAECRYTGHAVVRNGRLVRPVYHTEDDTPALDCACGIYGYYDRQSISALTVRGTVRASGKLLMGTHGARAAHAEIESLYVGDSYRSLYPEDFKAMAKVLRKRYSGVPVYTDLMEWVLDYPAEDVSALING